jgi:predicted transcriptional regulator
MIGHARSREVAMSKDVRFQLKMSQSIHNALDSLAEETGSSKGEVLTKALNLLLFARYQHKNGRQIAAVENGRVVTEVVGL